MIYFANRFSNVILTFGSSPSLSIALLSELTELLPRSLLPAVFLPLGFFGGPSPPLLPNPFGRSLLTLVRLRLVPWLAPSVVFGVSVRMLPTLCSRSFSSASCSGALGVYNPSWDSLSKSVTQFFIFTETGMVYCQSIPSLLSSTSGIALVLTSFSNFAFKAITLKDICIIDYCRYCIWHTYASWYWRVCLCILLNWTLYSFWIMSCKIKWKSCKFGGV